MKATCARCDTPGERRIRGLCNPCYRRCDRAGTLDDYPRVYRTSEEVIGDYAVLRLRGYTKREIAHLLGMKKTALDRALCRARAAGKRVAT